MSVHAIKTGTMTVLSMEQILACFAWKLKNPTCDEIFGYAKKYPLETAADYPKPPMAEETTCEYDPSKGVV